MFGRIYALSWGGWRGWSVIAGRRRLIVTFDGEILERAHGLAQAKVPRRVRPGAPDTERAEAVRMFKSIPFL